MNPSQQFENDTESETIRSDIEHTRQSMDETLDEITHRMKPRHLLDDVLSYFRSDRPDTGKVRHQARGALHAASDAAGRATHAVADTVRQHPLPSLLVGTGVALGVYELSHAGKDHSPDGGGSSLKNQALEGFEGGRERLQSAKEKVQGKFAETQTRARETAEQATRKLGGQVRGLREKAGSFGSQVTRSAKRNWERGREKLTETGETHPLIVGIGFLALGLMAGLALPRTRKENEWIGEASDQLKERARRKGREVMETARRAASAAKSAAQETAAAEELTPEGLREKAGHIAAESRNAAKEVLQPGSEKPDKQASNEPPIQPA